MFTDYSDAQPFFRTVENVANGSSCQLEDVVKKLYEKSAEQTCNAIAFKENHQSVISAGNIMGYFWFPAWNSATEKLFSKIKENQTRRILSWVALIGFSENFFPRGFLGEIFDQNIFLRGTAEYYRKIRTQV